LGLAQFAFFWYYLGIMSNDIETQDNDFETRVYEVGYLIMPSVVQDKVAEKVSAIRDVISSANGAVLAEGDPKYIDLAYDMTVTIANKKTTYSNGYFGWIKCEMDPEATKKVHASLEANTDLIRFILIKTHKEDTLAPISEALAKEAEDRFKKEREKNEAHKPDRDEKETDSTVEPASKEEIDETIEKLIVD
jgi:ribosomal protein S6